MVYEKTFLSGQHVNVLWGSELDVVYLDFAKSFNIVLHKHLINVYLQENCMYKMTKLATGMCPGSVDKQMV